MLIRKNRDFPPSLETKHGVPLAEHASEDTLNVSSKQLAAKGPPGQCGKEGMCPLNSHILRIQLCPRWLGRSVTNGPFSRSATCVGVVRLLRIAARSYVGMRSAILGRSCSITVPKGGRSGTKRPSHCSHVRAT